MVYNRKIKTYYKEEESKVLLFLYNHFLGRVLLKILTRKWFSSLAGWYMDSRFSKGRIKRFIKKNHIPMEDYIEEEYSSFNDFFIRKIKKEKRPLPFDTNLFLSPADARCMVYPISEDSVFKIKESYYTLEELLKDKELAKNYQGGYCFIYRLSVDDYHRYSYIDDGEVLKAKKIKGIFHTVQPISFKKYKVLQENTREYQVLKTKHFGTIVQMEVGALLVGRICNEKVKHFERGMEKGHFCFGGSTVVLLVPAKKVIPDEDILKHTEQGIESRVYLYDVVGRR